MLAELNNINPDVGEAIVRLMAAAALGAAIGIEREYHGREAGFRTQLLVALGSGLVMVLSVSFARSMGLADDTAGVRVDPSRAISGVMGGIGFLGAGAIIRSGTGIRGLTTAASLWCTAVVGLAAGAGLYLLASFATAIIVFALFVLARLEPILPTRGARLLTVLLPIATDNVPLLRQAAAKRQARISGIGMQRNFQSQEDTITLRLNIDGRRDASELLSIADDLPQIRRITLE